MAFMGMRGTGDWVANQVPESWREGILREYPNGMAPLTAIMSKMGSRKIDSYKIHWWEKMLPLQRATVTDIYIDATLITPYVYATHAGTIGIDGGTVYVRMSAADVSQFIPGSLVTLRTTGYPNVINVGIVTNVMVNGADSNLAVRLRMADAGDATSGLQAATLAFVVGSAFSEGAGIPQGLNYDVTEMENQTMISRNAISMTRTAMLTKLRTGDALAEARREALELHSIELEKALIWSVPGTDVGPNGEPRRTLRGLVSAIQTYAPANVLSYHLDADYTGQTWLESGETWLDATLEALFRYGEPEKLAICGSGALLGIQRLAKANGQFTFTSKTVSYGIKVVEWVTPFGTIYLKTHPLFSHEAVNRNAIMLLEPKQLQFCYITDTTLREDKNWKLGGAGSIDGMLEDYLTEWTIEFHHINRFGILLGVGLDSAL